MTRMSSQAFVVGGLGVLTAVNYLAWLGWDRRYDIDPDGNMSGPYQPWQVVGLVVVLGVLTVGAGWRGHAVAVTLAIPLVLTACFAITGATQPNDDGLWVVGAFLVAVGSAASVAAGAYLSQQAARRRASHVAGSPGR